MKRLVKKSVMNLEVFKSTLNQLGDKGRDILKNIEDYKFSLEQAARITANDQMLTQKIVQKRKSLDQAAAQIYSIVFDIENIDITQAYEQQTMVNNPMPSGNDMPEIPQNDKPSNNVPPNNMPPSNEPNEDSGMSGGGIPSGGAPSSPDGESEDKEDTDSENGENDKTTNDSEKSDAPDDADNITDTETNEDDS